MDGRGGGGGGGGAQRCRGDGVQRSAAQTSGEPNGRQPAPRRPFSEHQHQRPVGVEPLGRRRSVSVHGEVLWSRGPGACWKRPLKVRGSAWPRRWAAVVLGPAAIRRPQRRYPAGSAPRIDVWAPAPATTYSAGPRCSCPPLPDATGSARHSGAALRWHARGDPMAAGPGGPALRLVWRAAQSHHHQSRARGCDRRTLARMIHVAPWHERGTAVISRRAHSNERHRHSTFRVVIQLPLGGQTHLTEFRVWAVRDAVPTRMSGSGGALGVVDARDRAPLES
ncbi:hypothetical protein PCL_09184 [Purpureocillium lilacinum]|uniref:Uncharacterized protein n=1 Tax=Purpureocillium lilacinum TaxID=33203 RepID=A0A2U3EHC9_PURLI|nr:hypothetical protein PCL_09184 [Purpureocillium lilacinum]